MSNCLLMIFPFVDFCTDLGQLHVIKVVEFVGQLHDCSHDVKVIICIQKALNIPGGPIKTEKSIQSIFQMFAPINSYLFHLAG